MTIIFCALLNDRIIHASDRLVTLHAGTRVSAYNPVANKSLVVLSQDAIFTIGFCGLAYVGREPTDRWIARTIAGDRIDANAPAPFIFGGRQRLRLREILAALRTALLSVQTSKNHDLELLITGYRIQKRRLHQFYLTMKRTHDALQFEGNLRPFISLGPVWIGIGDLPAEQDILRVVDNHSPAVLEMAARDKMVSIIRERSQRSLLVGQNIMTITLDPFHYQVDVFFSASVPHFEDVGGASVNVDHRPWIITPGLIAPAGLGNGGSYHSGRWTFKLEGSATAPSAIWVFSTDPPGPPPPA